VVARLIRLGVVVAVAMILAGCLFREPDPAEMKEAISRVTAAMEAQVRSAQLTLPVGETLTAPSGETLTLSRVGAELPNLAPPVGKRLIVLEVTLTNPNTIPLPLNLAEGFWLADITGRRSLPIEVRGLPTDALPAGGTAGGTLAFAVEPDARDIRFAWQQYPMTAYVIP